MLPLLAYVAAVPTCVLAASGYSGHDVARIAQLAAMLLAAVMCCVLPLRSSAWSITTLILTTIGSALVIVSAATSAVPAMAARELALMAGLAAITWLTARTIEAQGASLARLAVLVGCGLYAALLVVIVAGSFAGGHTVTWENIVVGYDNYRFFNHVETAALPLLAGVSLQFRRRSLPWWTAWVSMTVYSAYVWCSGARGTALAIMAASLFATVLLGRRAAWPPVRALLLAGGIGAALYALVFLLLPLWTGQALLTPAERSAASLASDSARLQLWRLAVDNAADSPWLGLGPMHYAHVPNPKAAHPHNIYLQLAAEVGIPALMLLSLAAVHGLARLTRAIAACPAGVESQEGVTLWIACVAILFDGFVSGNFVMPVSQMWIALCIAWSWAWMRRHDPRPTDGTMVGTTGLRSTRLIAVAVLGSQLWLVTDVWPEAADLKAHLEHVRRDLVQNARTNPRFWSDGWF